MGKIDFIYSSGMARGGDLRSACSEYRAAAAARTLQFRYLPRKIGRERTCLEMIHTFST